MQTSLGLQVGTEQAALSQDAASPRNGRFLWIGSGFAVFMLIGISAHELMPLASHASAKPSHLVTEVAFKPLLPARSPGIRQIDPARPKGFSAAVLPLMQRPPGLRSAANGALHPPLRGAALRTSVSDADKPGEDGKEDDDKADDDTADEMDGAALMAQFNARIDQEGGATQFKAKMAVSKAQDSISTVAEDENTPRYVFLAGLAVLVFAVLLSLITAGPNSGQNIDALQAGRWVR